MSRFSPACLRMWINRSLQRQLFLAFAGMSLVIMLTLHVLLLKQQREFLHDANIRRISALAHGLASSAQPWMLSSDLAGLGEIIDGYRDTPDLIRILILNPDGEVYAASDPGKVGLFVSDAVSVDLLQRPALPQVLIANKAMIDVAAPILNGQRLIGWARVEVGQNELHANLKSLSKTHFGSVVLTLLVMMTMSIFLGRRLSHRLRQLSKVSQQIAAGNRSVRAKTGGQGEIADLAGNINRMLDSLTQSETSLALLNRVYAAWTECVNLIARETDESLLLNRLCQILVKHIGLRLAVISFVEGDWLRVVASNDWQPAYLRELKISICGDCPEGRGPLGRAIREASPQIFNDFQSDPDAAPWLHLAQREGVRSVGAFPLFRGGKIVGGISVYSQELNFFTEQVIALLNGLSADISFALDNIDREIARRHSERELRLAATVFENSQEGIVITDADCHIVRVNSTFTQLTGYLPEEIVGKKPSFLASGQHDAGFYRAMWRDINELGYWHGEIINRRKNGEVFNEWLGINRVLDDAGKVIHYVGACTDITERKNNEDRIHKLAFYDPLTDLPNRRLLIERLQFAMLESRRSRLYGAVMFMDLDRFKILNDTQGHAFGDQLLIEVSHRLTSCLREQDTIARLGGDEFVVMLEGLGEDKAAALAFAQRIANKILTSMRRPFNLSHLDDTGAPINIVHHSSVSIGLNMFRGAEINCDELLKQADVAMYQAKHAGRNMVCAFNPEIQAHLNQRAMLEADMRQAIASHGFLLYYQAQVDDRGKVVGAEVLLRWQHPRLGWIPPSEFIPLAEETGLIDELGLWVLKASCNTLSKWACRPQTRDLTLSVNVSPKQFNQSGFKQQVRALLEACGFEPGRLKLEVTESVVLGNVNEAIATMNDLLALGVSFSMDDFGTGYSSLSYLQRLPLNQLKIDQSFVRNLNQEGGDNAIIRTILSLGESMQLAVIAEGVETKAQYDYLVANGCKFFQGYWFGCPEPLPKFEERLFAEPEAMELRD